jgi:hypothetical protein
MCLKYEVVPYDLSAITSPMQCMMGGAIYATQHPAIDHNGIEWTTNGQIRCESDPPNVNEVNIWVEREKARIARTESQIK